MRRLSKKQLAAIAMKRMGMYDYSKVRSLKKQDMPKLPKLLRVPNIPTGVMWGGEPGESNRHILMKSRGRPAFDSYMDSIFVLRPGDEWLSTLKSPSKDFKAALKLAYIMDQYKHAESITDPEEKKRFMESISMDLKTGESMKQAFQEPLTHRRAFPLPALFEGPVSRKQLNQYMRIIKKQRKTEVEPDYAAYLASLQDDLKEYNSIRQELHKLEDKEKKAISKGKPVMVLAESEYFLSSKDLKRQEKLREKLKLLDKKHVQALEVTAQSKGVVTQPYLVATTPGVLAKELDLSKEEDRIEAVKRVAHEDAKEDLARDIKSVGGQLPWEVAQAAEPVYYNSKLKDIGKELVKMGKLKKEELPTFLKLMGVKERPEDKWVGRAKSGPAQLEELYWNVMTGEGTWGANGFLWTRRNGKKVKLRALKPEEFEIWRHKSKKELEESSRLGREMVRSGEQIRKSRNKLAGLAQLFVNARALGGKKPPTAAEFKEFLENRPGVKKPKDPVPGEIMPFEHNKIIVTVDDGAKVSSEFKDKHMRSLGFKELQKKYPMLSPSKRNMFMLETTQPVFSADLKKFFNDNEFFGRAKVVSVHTVPEKILLARGALASASTLPSTYMESVAAPKKGNKEIRERSRKKQKTVVAGSKLDLSGMVTILEGNPQFKIPASKLNEELGREALMSYIAAKKRDIDIYNLGEKSPKKLTPEQRDRRKRFLSVLKMQRQYRKAASKPQERSNWPVVEASQGFSPWGEKSVGLQIMGPRLRAPFAYPGSPRTPQSANVEQAARMMSMPLSKKALKQAARDILRDSG
jgi:hypothetical protein